MRYCIRYVVRKAGVFSRKMVFMPSSVFLLRKKECRIHEESQFALELRS
uniref:Uncharacterized protein n=1 Tax=Anguilla anguilla TaxID=7936 RepID=A0A0E9S835_ANGAN